MSDEQSRSSAASQAFSVLTLRVPDAAAGEWAAAEAFEAGAAGAEEREDAEGKRLLLYVPDAALADVRRAIEGLSVPGLAVLSEASVQDVDWSEAWKEGLTAIEISPRLRIRPSFVAAGALGAGQAELVIDPAQAFGTGGHESTRLALECIAALAPLPAETRALDVGAGTGVLALAALRLGARRAVAFDLDPLAGEAVGENAARNGLAAHVDAFTGPIDALRGPPFELVLANLLRRESEPLLAAIAARTRPGGRVVFSGLLETDRSEFSELLARQGLRVDAERTRADASGVVWLGLVARRAGG